MIKPYRNIIQGLRTVFHVVSEGAQRDHAIRTDEPEKAMFSTTLHLMLTAVTRYAIGLLHIPEGRANA